MSDSEIVKSRPATGKPGRRRLRVLTKRSDFLKTFRSGRKVRPAEWMIFNFANSESFGCGWTCPKAVGGAPMRNKLKRWTREWLRAKAKAPEDLPQVDLNIGFRGMPADFYMRLKRSDFDQSMERGWKQLLTQIKKTPSDRLIKPVTKLPISGK